MAVDAKLKRTTKRPEDRRRDLMDAALRVLHEKGANVATVSDITEEAGGAKGTFYLSFDSKEHLLAALPGRILADALALCMGWGRDSGRDRLYAAAREVSHKTLA